MNILSKFGSSQLRRNVLSGALSASASFFISLIKYPVFLWFMSYELYGVWLVLTTVLSFAQLGLVSVSVGIVKLVAEEYGKNNVSDVEKYVATALAALLTTGLFLFVLSFVFRHEIVNLLGITGPNIEIGITYLPLIALLSIYIFVYEIINATLSALGRIDIANYSQTWIQAIPVIIAIPLFLIHIPPFISMLAAHFAAYLLITITNVRKINSIVELKIFKAGNISLAHFTKLFRFSGAMLFSSLASLLFFPVSKIIVSRHLGVQVVPLYEVAYRASYQVVTVFSTGLRALVPEISRLSSITKEETAHLIKRINAKAYLISIIGGAVTCAIVILLADIIFRLWLGKSFNREIVTCFRIMMGGTLVSIAMMVPYFNMIGRGDIHSIVLYHCISPIVSILAIAVLLISYGITLNGVAVANSLGILMGALFLAYKTFISYQKTPVDKQFAPVIE